ncbi:30S ribosomal protein S3 [Candidatus Dojkabacteria bacterium]|uniref:Small ribosomal subunit protein uS3 n=1 Tax=Candidatus Dojkabacteria bacterium TaxID=2099670 RepID=A0A3M0Z1V6_9BACT|nr:MAG: 30S ribosomal protein S3 [Candidatus Dojkabacteria bacterium]
MARGSHKVNPVIFRMTVNKIWDSRWFASDKSVYIENLKQDFEIRKIVTKDLAAAGVAKIVIDRGIKKVFLSVYVARPGVAIGRNGVGISNLKEKLEKKFKMTFEIKLYEVKKPEACAALIAEAIAEQCERRVAPKIAVQKVLESVKNIPEVKGISIWVRGRIKGVDMARVEKYSEGFVPRHSIRADIDYAFVEARVPRAGKHGIKVWVNLGERNTYVL